MGRPVGSPPLSASFAAAAQAIAHRLSGGQGAGAPRTPAVTDLIYRGTRYWGLAQVRCGRLAQQKPDAEIVALLAIAWAAIDQTLRESHVVIHQAGAFQRAIGCSRSFAQATGSDKDARSNAFTKPEIFFAAASDRPAAKVSFFAAATASWTTTWDSRSV